MNNNVSMNLINGLGDKCLDLIGAFVLCKFLNYKLNIFFYNDGYWAWGNNNYDMRLFHFDEVEIIFEQQEHPFYLHSVCPSSSLCPYKVYEFLKQFLPQITFEQVSSAFEKYSKQIISPSEIILSNIPKNIDNAYGIHLRKSDKVNDYCDIRHENTLSDFEIITNNLLEDLKIIMMNEENVHFLVVSEDNQWKEEFTNRILNFAHTNDKHITIVNIDYSRNDGNYSNYNSVLDMFCLSKCKEILQGVKYSTFSMLASILGNNKIRNYSHFTDSYEKCLIHSWSSVLEVNNKKNFDIEKHQRISDTVTNLNTNITTMNITTIL